MRKETDQGGGVHRARSGRAGVFGALIVLLATVLLGAGPVAAEPDADVREDGAENEEGPSAAPDDEATPDDEDVGPTIRTLASNRHMLVKARSLRLTEEAADRLLLIAKRFHADTRRKLVITGGERNAARQADLMHKKLENGEDLIKLYSRDDLVRPIVSAYEHGKQDGHSRKRTVRAMTDVIQTQVDKKQYVSRHLAFTAADVRSRDMTVESADAFKEAVKSVPGVVLIDERKSAAPCFHLSM